MSYILSDTQRETIKKYIETQPQKIVKKFDYKNKKIEYCDELKGRDIKTLKDEEIVRAYLLTKFVNELGYDISKIEIEHEYKAGRPHTNTSRIDVIVRDKNNDVFLFVELKKIKILKLIRVWLYNSEYGKKNKPLKYVL